MAKLRSAKKGPQANTVLPPDFPIQRCPPEVPFNVDQFMNNLAADLAERDRTAKGDSDVEQEERDGVDAWTSHYGSRAG